MSSSLGDPIRAFGGDPKFKLLSLVKNKALADAGADILAKENAQSVENSSRLRNYQGKWDSAQALRDKYTNEQVGAIGDVYDGDLQRTLAGNQALAFNRMDEATDVNSLLNAGALKGQFMKMGGSDAGLRMGLALKSIAGLKSQNALAKSGMTMGDQRYLTGLQLGNVGRQQGLIDANINSGLIPMQAFNAETARRVGIQSGLADNDAKYMMYGAQQHKTGLDKWAELGNSIGRISMDAASTYGAAMNGGGAQAQQSPYSMQGNPFGNQFGGGGSYFGGYGGNGGTASGGSLGFGNMNLGGYSMGGGGGGGFGGGGGLDMTGGMGTGGL